jgi:nucleoside-diphosphate-sugar epimerase
MKSSLFITGAGGFVGRHLLEKLDYSKYKTVYCLALKMEDVDIPDALRDSPQLEIIEGDLLDVASYQSALEQSETVIHMAAITGKVGPKVYFKINAYGTMLLLDRCKQAGVKHFLFISSIAVSFKNKYRYFYGFSKEQAEDYVKNSGLKYTIIRPTMIMGKGSNVFEGLASLAGLPVIPLFGKGDNEIQPVDVTDIAKALVRIENESRYKGEILELGGPQPITLLKFMKMIAEAKGKKNAKIIHLPITIIIFFLSILERVVYRFLPLSVGQMATFRNDGSVENNSLMKKLSPMMVGLEQMIRNGLETDPLPDVPEELVKECHTFSRYLSGMKPSVYILDKYYLCHQTIDFTPVDFHDKLLLKVAKKGAFFTRMTDAYSRFFRSNSIVRKKLAYLMAILEVSPPYYRFFDSADKSGKLGLFIKTGLKGTAFALHLFFSFLFFFPVQVLAKFSSTKKEDEVEKN